MIRNFVFDMGNVMIRFVPAEYAVRLGAPPEIAEELGRLVYRTVEWAQLDRGIITTEEAERGILRRIPEEYREVARKMVSGWFGCIAEIPEMTGLIRELKARGFGIYLLSNAGPDHALYWPKLSGSTYFDGLMVSYMVKRVKPEHEIYEALLEKYALKPSECLFIDDHASNVEASIYAGMPGILFDGNMEKLRAAIEEKISGEQCRREDQ